jgi:hypothetical protein
MDEIRDIKGGWRVESGGTFAWCGRGLAYRTTDELHIVGIRCVRCDRPVENTIGGLKLQNGVWTCIELVACNDATLLRAGVTRSGVTPNSPSEEKTPRST